MPVSIMTMSASRQRPLDPVGHDDAALLARAAQGDDGAFALLVARHRPLLLRIARAVVGDASRADDVVQDALLRAFHAAKQWRARGTVRAWMAVIALNTARNHALEMAARQRRERALGALSHEPVSHPEPDPVLAAETVWACVDGLPADERDVVVLHYRGGLAASEVATQLGITRFGVHKRLARALATLRRMLGVRRAALLALLALPLTGEASSPPSARGSGRMALLTAGTSVALVLLALPWRPSPRPPVEAPTAAVAVEPPPQVVVAPDPAQRAWELVPVHSDLVLVLRMSEGNRAALASSGFPFVPKALAEAAGHVVIAGKVAHLRGNADGRGIFLLEPSGADAAWTRLGNELATTTIPRVHVQPLRLPAGEGWRVVFSGNIHTRIALGGRPYGWGTQYWVKPDEDARSNALVLVRVRPDVVVVAPEDRQDAAQTRLFAPAGEPRSPAIDLIQGMPAQAGLRLAASPSPELEELADGLQALTAAIGPTPDVRVSFRFATVAAAEEGRSELARAVQLLRQQFGEIPADESASEGDADPGETEAIQAAVRALADATHVGGEGDRVELQVHADEIDPDAFLRPISRQ